MRDRPSFDHGEPDAADAHAADAHAADAADADAADRRAARGAAARSGRRSGRLAELGLAVASLAITAILMELGLRVFWDGYYLKTEHAYAAPHPTRGWTNVPGRVIEYGEPEYSTRITHNSLGFRGPELQPRREGMQRVLVLGDSFTYGIGVQDDETFSARLAELEPSLEVVNTGVNGYGTGQQWLVLREEGPSLAPDIVVLAFFWNDVANNVERDGLRFALEGGELRPPPPQPVLPQVAAAPQRREWLRHSYLYRFTSDRLKVARFAVRSALGIPLEDGDRLPPERREPAWQVEEAILREIRAETQRLQARLLLVIIPEQAQVQPTDHVLGLVEADYAIQDRLSALAGRLDIPVLDLLPALREAHERTGKPLYYRYDRHLLPSAHTRVAERLRDELRALGWIEAPAGQAGS